MKKRERWRKRERETDRKTGKQTEIQIQTRRYGQGIQRKRETQIQRQT